MLPQIEVIPPAAAPPSGASRAQPIQTELAHKIRAKQKSISRYETGASVPTIETLTKIANALKKSPAYFLEGLS